MSFAYDPTASDRWIRVTPDAWPAGFSPPAGALPFERDEPCNDLPPRPPKVELESKAVLKAAIAAHRAFADGPTMRDEAATKEVLRCKRALWVGFESLANGRPLSTTT